MIFVKFNFGVSLTPNMMGFGGGAFGRQLGVDEVMRIVPL